MNKSILLIAALLFLAAFSKAQAAYDSNVGRWVERDPIGESGGLNLYAYVWNNPLNGIDPTGLYFVPTGTPEQQQYINQALQDLSSASSNTQMAPSYTYTGSTLTDLLQALQASSQPVYITLGKGSGPEGSSATPSRGGGAGVEWDPCGLGSEHNANLARLAHELQHANDLLNGLKKLQTSKEEANNYEERAVRRENQASADLHDFNGGPYHQNNTYGQYAVPDPTGDPSR